MAVGTNMSVLKANGISRRYGSGHASVRALNNISLIAKNGDFIGLQGPSGCGKSTLLSILGLVDMPTAGQVILNDQVVDFDDRKQLEQLRRFKLGFVFQYFNLLPTLSTLENAMLPALLCGDSVSSAERKATELLVRVGLAERLKHYPHELSGGEMQRVALCRAVIHQPVLILADEPTGNLDSHAGAVVLDALVEITKRGTCVIMASHSQTALSRCDRVIELLDGELAHAR